MGIVNFPEGYDDNVSSGMSVVDVYRAKLEELNLPQIEAAAKNDSKFKNIYDKMHSIEEKFKADVNAIENYEKAGGKKLFAVTFGVVAVVSAAIMATAAFCFPVTIPLLGVAMLISLMLSFFVLTPIVLVMQRKEDKKMAQMAHDSDLDGMLNELSQSKTSFINLANAKKSEKQASLKKEVAPLRKFPTHSEIAVQQNESHRTLSLSQGNNLTFFDEAVNQSSSAVQGQRKRANSLR